MRRICLDPTHLIRTGLLAALLVPMMVLVGACGDDGGGGGSDANTTPTDVKFGDTVIVAVVNPVVNDANDGNVPAPGLTRAGVVLTSDDGVSATTDVNGVAVLGPLQAGTRTITAAGDSIDGTFTVTIGAGELRELAVAADDARVEIMVEIDYKSSQVVEVTPTMTNQEVNDALKVSDTVVFFRGGSYTGDLDFSGSRVTLFGEGVLGGEVIIDGNVEMSGSNSRIRGTQITGNVTVPASGVGLSFSQVDGTTTGEGSDLTLLSNALCGTATLTGSGSIILGNAGLAPTTACP